MVPRRHVAKERLCMEGDNASTVWFVKKGLVVLRVGGDAHTLCSAGTLVGGEAILDSKYAASAQVATPSTLCSATSPQFSEWLGPPSAARITLEESLRSAPSKRTLRGQSSNARTAGWILANIHTPEALDLSRETVAELIGIRSETLSRALASIAATGAITVTRTTLEVNDYDLLEVMSNA